VQQVRPQLWLVHRREAHRSTARPPETRSPAAKPEPSNKSTWSSAKANTPHAAKATAPLCSFDKLACVRRPLPSAIRIERRLAQLSQGTLGRLPRLFRLLRARSGRPSSHSRRNSQWKPTLWAPKSGGDGLQVRSLVRPPPALRTSQMNPPSARGNASTSNGLPPPSSAEPATVNSTWKSVCPLARNECFVT